MQDEPVIHLQAFVGRSFLDDDKRVWHELRDFLETLKSLGFAYEDAKEAQLCPISEKVRLRIDRNHIYIGVLTRRHLISSVPCTIGNLVRGLLNGVAAKQWTASEWVIEEVGYAIGREKPVILLIEKSVVFPTSDLDGDTQWIEFERDKLEHCQSELVSMISGLLAKKVVALPAVSAISADDSKTEEQKPAHAPSKATFGEQLNALRVAASSARIADVERIQSEILNDPQIMEKREFENFLLSERASHGDTAALQILKKRVSDGPSDVDALIGLAESYEAFKQYSSSIDLLRNGRTHVAPVSHARIALGLAFALRKDGKPQEAVSELLVQLRMERDEEKRINLYRAIAYAAQEYKDSNLEAACLEKILKLIPADNDVRFRLAYLYGETERQMLAAYHYGLLAPIVDWPHVLNNLGVAYGELGLKAARIDQFLKASDKSSLAKANAANLYANFGFLSQAATLAHDVMANISADEIASARARTALSEIEALREKEEVKIKAISDETRNERDFMVTFADALDNDTVEDFVATFVTPHGDLRLSKEHENLSGTGSMTKPAVNYPAGTLAGLAGFGAARSLPARNYQLNLTGTCRGRTAVYKLKISSNEEPISLLESNPRTIVGQLVFADRAASFKALEREGNKTSFAEAGRKM